MLANIVQTDLYRIDMQLADALSPILLDWTRQNDPHDLHVFEDQRERSSHGSCRQHGHNAEYGVVGAGEGATTSFGTVVEAK